MQHRGATGAIESIGFREAVRHVGEEGAVERPHGAADLVQQGLGQHAEPLSEPLGTALELLARAPKTLAHVDAMVAVADRAVERVEAVGIGDDDPDHRAEDRARLV